MCPITTPVGTLALRFSFRLRHRALFVPSVHGLTAAGMELTSKFPRPRAIAVN